MTHLVHDIRYALRGFLRTPAFALTGILTLTVGTAGLTTVFTLVNELLLKPLAVERPGELFTLAAQREQRGELPIFSYPQYEMLRESPGLTGIAAYSAEFMAVRVGGAEPQMLPGYAATAEYFRVLGVRPAAGRFFTPGADDDRGGSAVAVISHQLWQTQFGGEPDAVGATIHVNGQPLTVIGVAPRGFRGTLGPVQAAFWVPATLMPVLRPGMDIYTPGRHTWLTLVGRLEPGTTARQAATSLTGLLRSLAQSGAEFQPARTQQPAITGIALQPLRPLPQFALAPALGFLGVLFSAALLVLLIAAVNLTSMMLARSLARARELAVRRSLGASRLHLVAQIMTESLLLFVAGAAAGLLLSAWVTSLLPGLIAHLPVPVDLDLSLNARVVAFALLCGFLAGLLFGLAPALHATRAQSLPALREGAATPRSTRMRSAFVTGQLALSMLLLIAAGLLGRALQRSLAIDPGFSTTNVAAAEIDLTSFGYDGARGRSFFEQLTERLRARADVQEAATSQLALLTSFGMRVMRPEGQDEPPAGGLPYNVVDPDYFDLLRIPRVAGRTFSPGDRAGTPLVAVVNEAFVRQWWPDGRALGRLIHEGPDEDRQVAYEVVGVVATTKYRSLAEEATPVVYLAHAQRGGASGAIYARSDAGAATALQAIRTELRALDPNVPPQLAWQLDQTVSFMLTPQRVAAVVLAVFGATGLLLALVGMYGLVAYSVAQRRAEIGIRMALGARERDVVAMFLRQGAKLLAGGAAIGVSLALLTGQLLTSLLYGVSPVDPVAFLALPLLLVATALLATWLPSRRASRISPATVLRAE